MLSFFFFFFHHSFSDIWPSFCVLHTPLLHLKSLKSLWFHRNFLLRFLPFLYAGIFCNFAPSDLFILFFFNQTSILSGALFFHRIDSQRVYLLVSSVHESLLSSSPSPSGVCFPSWGLQTLYLPPWHCPPPPHSPAVPFSRLELTVAMPPGKLLSLLLHEKTPVPHSPSTLCPG